MTNFILYDKKKNKKNNKNLIEIDSSTLEKFGSFSTIDIFKDRIVTFTGLGLGKLDNDVTIFVVVSPRLAESYRTWWQYIWSTLPEEKPKKKTL